MTSGDHSSYKIYWCLEIWNTLVIYCCLKIQDIFLQNLLMLKNREYLGNLFLLENTGYLPRLMLENRGYLWNLLMLENREYLHSLLFLENTAYLCNLLMLKHTGYLRNILMLENTGYLWNLLMLENTGRRTWLMLKNTEYLFIYWCLKAQDIIVLIYLISLLKTSTKVASCWAVRKLPHSYGNPLQSTNHCSEDKMEPLHKRIYVHLGKHTKPSKNFQSEEIERNWFGACNNWGLNVKYVSYLLYFSES